MSRDLLRVVRRVWVTVGLMAGIVFIVWSLLAYRATADARAALVDSLSVKVTRGEAYWRFDPPSRAEPGLLFFPGALVEPAAYAPVAQAVAARGYTALLVEVPWRGGFGGAESPDLHARYMRALRETSEAGGPRRWVVAGHSRGGVIASQLARSLREGIAGLVLIGTSHPRDFSLAHLQIPVTRIYGTRDTVADVEKLEATRHNLPASARIIRIDGGNHSQFGYYGFQPGDWPATISRAEQQRLTIDGIVETLAKAR